MTEILVDGGLMAHGGLATGGGCFFSVAEGALLLGGYCRYQG